MITAISLYLSHLSEAALDLAALARLIDEDPAAAATVVRQNISDEELGKGATPIDAGTRVLFAARLPSGDHQIVVVTEGRVLSRLKKLDESHYASVLQLKDGEAHLVDYQVDGKPLRLGLQVEVYDPNPFVLTPPGGLKGELLDMGELRCKTFPDTLRRWYVYLPPGLDPAKEYPVMIGQDAQWDRQWQANGLENCAAKGLIPPTVGVFIEPGQDKAGNYGNRSKEYDSLDAHYSQFLLTEVLPAVEKLVKLSKEPAKRALVGMSSGGICSFTACWERPDQFGVALSFIGSFANIASGDSKREGGHNYPFLIRKNENKPIRVYLQDGARDLDNVHGSWWLCNQQMASALKFKGYDFVWSPGEGFHNTKHARRLFDKVLVWWLRSSEG